MTDHRRPLHDEPLPVIRAAALPVSRGLFDDEIAIDFPSMGPVIERMRDALLGADDAGAPRRAEISLSFREASDGAVVPLEVPVRRTCLRCGGRGESWAEPCAGCQGSGECSTPHHVTLSVPAGVTHGTRFQFLVATPQGLPTRIEVTVVVA